MKENSIVTRILLYMVLIKTKIKIIVIKTNNQIILNKLDYNSNKIIIFNHYNNIITLIQNSTFNNLLDKDFYQ